MNTETKLLAGLTSVALTSSLIVTFALTGTALAQTQTAPTQGGGWGMGRMMQHPGVFGTVASINGSTITLTGRNNTTYTVDATNATVTKSNSPSTLSTIAVGDTLMIEGTVSGNSVTATAIHDGMGGMGMKGGRGMMPGVMGTVSAITGSTLTVTGTGPQSGTTYTVDATTAKVTKDGSSSSVSAIASGDTVMIRGSVTGTNVTATDIRDGVGPRGKGTDQEGQGSSLIQGNGQPVIGGSVSAINGSSLTVTTKTNLNYSVDATNAMIKKSGATSTVANMTVGDSVIVQGAVNGTSVTASSIIDSGVTAQAQDGNNPHGSFGGFMGGIGNLFHRLFGFF